MLSATKPVIIKEFRQIVRDKRTLGVLLFIPAFMLVMFGYALNFDVKHITLAVYDEDNSNASRNYINNFLHSGYFDLIFNLDSASEIDCLMGDERVRAAIVIPIGFSEKILAGKEAVVQIIIDGADANAATTVIGYVNAITGNYSKRILMESLMRTGSPEFSLPIDYHPRVWFNPELRSVKFLVPGLIGFILMVTAVISTALSVVREKERGTMEQISVSPIGPVELILGKTVPYILISIIATVVILIVGYMLFDVVVRGSIIILFLVTLIFLTGCLGLGLLISTIAETQQVAFTISVFLTMLPTFLLSGFVFPIRNMPLIIQILTYFVPARYYLIALRSIILKGMGFAAFWDQLLFLIGFAVLTIGLSSFRMRKMKI